MISGIFYFAIFVAFMALFYGYYMSMYFMRKKLKKSTDDIDFKTELNNASMYLDNFLNRELSFIKEQFENTPIDALNYVSTEYTAKDRLKDQFKDTLKRIATLGLVKFNTIQTPKYLILSGNDLHLIDTDVDGKISNHLAFDAFRLEKSSISEDQTYKAFAEVKTKNMKAFKLSLATDGKPIELIIFSSLIHTASGANYVSLDKQKNIEEVIIASDFLKKLGDKYPNLKVSLPF